MKGGSRLIPGVPLNVRKDIDEDLLLFKQLHKRDRDRQASLLQPVSEEFEPNGNNTLYRIGSGKKASGHEFFGENGKNDYDWLKTPPATPLFPSLEMEANPPQLVVQREIPILRPLSKFAGSSNVLGGSTATTKATSPGPLRPNNPQRSSTPNRRPNVSSHLNETKNSQSVSLIPRQKMAQLATDDPNKETKVTARPANERESQTTLQAAASNLSKSTVGLDSATTKTSTLGGRGLSTWARSKIAVQIPGFSNDAPPNLRADCATSVTRCRPSRNPAVGLGLFHHQKPEAAVPKSRRQSCSPSTARGRRETQQALTSQNSKGKLQTAGNGGQFLGSKMVEKVMNARTLSASEEREGELKPRGQGRLLTVASAERERATGFRSSRITSNSKTSLDLA